MKKCGNEVLKDKAKTHLEMIPVVLFLMYRKERLTTCSK